METNSDGSPFKTNDVTTPGLIHEEIKSKELKTLKSSVESLQKPKKTYHYVKQTGRPPKDRS